MRRKAGHIQCLTGVARAFVAACKNAEPGKVPEKLRLSRCQLLMPDVKRLTLASLRASAPIVLGAEIKGRCVTYNHPEDQKVPHLDRFAPLPTWPLDGFAGWPRLPTATRKAPGCSDGCLHKSPSRSIYSEREQLKAAKPLYGSGTKAGLGFPAILRQQSVPLL